MNNDSAFIKMIDVHKTYATPAGDFPALRGISANFYAGEFIAVVGKSGAGKSTFVNVLTGVDHLTSGQVWVGETPVHTLNENNMSLWRGVNVGVVYQSFQLIPQLSILDNVMLPMDFCGGYRPARSREHAMHLLEQVEIAEHAYKSPRKISGGQQQRVAIARALANDPDLIVADEPTGNLDSITAETIYQLFEQFVAQGKTIIMVTHDYSIAKRVDHFVRLADGKITEDIRGAKPA